MSIQQIAKQLDVLQSQKERIQTVSAIPSDMSSELLNVGMSEFADLVNNAAKETLVPHYENEIDRLNNLVGVNNG